MWGGVRKARQILPLPPSLETGLPGIMLGCELDLEGPHEKAKSESRQEEII